MGSLRVDLDVLHQLQGRCQTLNQQFDDGSHDRVAGLIEQVGSSRLRDALAEFEDHWSDGRAKVKRHLDGLVERLGSAIEQYEHTESELTRQLAESSR
jgi:hypothetical protein